MVAKKVTDDCKLNKIGENSITLSDSEGKSENSLKEKNYSYFTPIIDLFVEIMEEKL